MGFRGLPWAVVQRPWLILSHIRVQDTGGEASGSRRLLGLLSSQMFGNWTFGTLVFTVMVLTVTLKVSHCSGHMPVMASLPAALLELLESQIHADTGTPC